MTPGAESVSLDDLLARSGVVDHEALREGLTAGTIAGAALDVTEPEMTVENLRAGLRGEPLPYRVRPAK